MANLVCEGYLLTKPTERKLGEEIVNALHLGQRSVASDLLSQLGSGEQALRARSFIPILQYCARMPDPLVGILSPQLCVAHPPPFGLLEFLDIHINLCLNVHLLSPSLLRPEIINFTKLWYPESKSWIPV